MWGAVGRAPFPGRIMVPWAALRGPAPERPAAGLPSRGRLPFLAAMLRDFLISAAAGLACFATLHAAEPEAAPPQRVELPPLHTSIYVGSVKLRTEPFLRSGDSLTYNSKYQATVVPWVFWNEAGDIALTIPEETMTHFLAGDGHVGRLTRCASTFNGMGDGATLRGAIDLDT